VFAYSTFAFIFVHRT